MYIVMLPHLFDIGKIEVLAKDQYKLKVNTKKVDDGEELHYHVWTSVRSLSSSFVWSRKAEGRIGKLKN